MNRRAFLHTLVGGLSTAVLLDPQLSATTTPTTPPTLLEITGPPEIRRWSKVIAAMLPLREGERGYWLRQDLGGGWWRIYRLTQLGDGLVQRENGRIWIGAGDWRTGQVLPARDLQKPRPS